MKNRTTLVQIRSHEYMDKSHGGLRTEEFPHLPKSMQPMEHFTADLANMDGNLR